MVAMTHSRGKRPIPPQAPPTETGEPSRPRARRPGLPVWTHHAGEQRSSNLLVNHPDDSAERYAEEAAQTVQAADPERAGRAAGGGPQAETAGEDGLQRAPLPGAGAGDAGAAPSIVDDVVRSPGQPLSAGVRAYMEGRFGRDFSGVRVHVDAQAAESARAVQARAYTVGRHVVFGTGRYLPDTHQGRRLLAHELSHVVQQESSRHAAVQRDDEVVQMPAETVTSSLRPAAEAVSNLDTLRGEGVTADDVSLAHGEESIQRNAPDAAARLPFRAGGWDGNAIITRLGQYDTVPGTDSDALRCVQAVSMVSRIIRGPQEVIGYLRATILDGMMSRPMGERQRTAINVLEHVIGRIETQRATFGDLLFAQEALHDLSYNDVSGTPQEDFASRIAPALDLGTNMEPLDIWCNTSAEVVAQAGQLQPGEQLLVNTWQVIFNSAFDQLSEQGIEVREGRTIVVSINGRRRRIRRISTATRPDPGIIDPNRDRQLGHQLLVFRDGATGDLRLYEPEITSSGRHLEGLAEDGSNFERYFQDLPDVGVYNYIQILGKLTPATWASSPSTGFTAP